MTAQRDPDRMIRAFLMDGHTELADPVFDAVRATIEHKRQRVVIGPWRMPNAMNKFAVLGLGTAAVVVALVVGMQFLPTAPGGVGTAPSALPSPTPTATPVAAPTSSAVSGLPKGPFVVKDASDGLPPITTTIAAPGWAFDPEFSALGKGQEVDNLPEAAILMWAFAAGTGFDVYSDPCRWKSTRPATSATTVDAFAAALAAQPSRDGSPPVDTTIGGYAAKSFTLHVPSDAVFADCDDGNFGSYGVVVDGQFDPTRWHQGPGQIDEFWIVDVAGSIVVLDAMYRSDTSAELIDELRAIATSTTFK